MQPWDPLKRKCLVLGKQELSKSPTKTKASEMAGKGLPPPCKTWVPVMQGGFCPLASLLAEQHWGALPLTKEKVTPTLQSPPKLRTVVG